MNLVKDPLSGLLRKIAIPAAMGMMLQVGLNLTDIWFAGKISTEAQAGLSLSFSLVLLLSTFSTGLSIGGAALIGNFLGGKDFKNARLVCGQLVILAAAIAVGLMISGPFISSLVFKSLGATGNYLAISVRYMNILFFSSLPYLFIYAANGILTAQGDSRSLRNALFLGFCLNFPLDYFLLFGFKGWSGFGFSGLALAKTIIYVLTMFYLWMKVFKTGIFGDKFKKSLAFNLKLMLQLLSQSIPAALNMASIGLGVYIINWYLKSFGSDAIAAYGIAVRLEQLVLLPTMGLSLAVLPLTAQNDGANLKERVNEIRKLAIRWGLIFSALGFFILFLLGNFFISFFSQNNFIIYIGALYLKIDGAILFAYFLLAANISHLQGRKKPMFALWIGLYRQILAPLIVYTILVKFFGITGLWIGIALVTISAALISELYLKLMVEK